MALPDISLQVAFASEPFAALPDWTIISSYMMDFSLRVGRNSALDQQQAGAFRTTLLNADGRFWPLNASGDYYPNVLPGKRIRVQGGYNEVTAQLFTGFVTDWAPGFSGGGTGLAIAQMSASDLRRNLANMNLNDGTGYPAELSGARIGRVLDAIGWPAADRDLDSGQTMLQATGPLENVNALSHIQSVEQAELGYLFIDGDGHVQWHDRHHKLHGDHLTSQATFGDGAGELPYADIEVDFSDELVYNDVRFQRTGGIEQVAADTASQATYGIRTLSRTGLPAANDALCMSIAKYYRQRHKDAHFRIRSITIEPERDPINLWPQVMGIGIGKRITIRLDAASLDADFHIEGVEHRISQSNHWWQTKWWLSDADPVVYWKLGVSKLGTETILAY